ncbi:MAG: MerR family DNA-binding transcriptional regulator [Xanthomonadales bacterium]
MQKTFSISDLAQEFGVTTRTIRFYEEKGLLNPSRDGPHRRFSAGDRTKLRLILRGKRLGLSLDESAEIIGMYGTPGNNRRQLETLLSRIEEKRAELMVRRRELDAMLREMEQAERKCRTAMNELDANA